jgi:hypothetical protein
VFAQVFDDEAHAGRFFADAWARRG